MNTDTGGLKKQATVKWKASWQCGLKKVHMLETRVWLHSLGSFAPIPSVVSLSLSRGWLLHCRVVSYNFILPYQICSSQDRSMLLAEKYIHFIFVKQRMTVLFFFFCTKLKGTCHYFYCVHFPSIKHDSLSPAFRTLQHTHSEPVSDESSRKAKLNQNNWI